MYGGKQAEAVFVQENTISKMHPSKPTPIEVKKDYISNTSTSQDSE